MSNLLNTARLLLGSGIACIPVQADKRPKPKFEWKQFQTELPAEFELDDMLEGAEAIAAVGGVIQCLDFDEKYSRGIFARYVKKAEEVGLDQILGQLVLQKTPSGGFHLVWRCESPVGNLKLASKANKETMIETRGQGGYFLLAPSAGYVLEQGDWSAIPVISEDDRDALLNLARTFDERAVVEPVEQYETKRPDTGIPATGNAVEGETPGDHYDRTADVPALLRKHGWKSVGQTSKVWTRPGKASGISAVWNDRIPDRFYVFSTSTAFKNEHPYRPWHVYAMLECGGDYAAAAGELRRQGFGGARKEQQKPRQLAPQWDGNGEPPATGAPDEGETLAIEGCGPDGPKGADPMGNAPTNESEEDKIRRLLFARAFDPTREPPPIRPIFSLGGVVISTPGNLTAITAQAKMGKSSLVAAFTAASMTPPDRDIDTLSAKGFNKDSKALLYFDTEQAPDDFWHAVNRAKRRAQVETLPDWLAAFTVADLPTGISRKALSIAMADASEIHGGIHAVILDGVADLVLDVNDAEECNGLVAELHTLSIRYDCSILCVIHKNPGSEKVRGHLGSQIERKAETNLSLDKEGEVTVVWSNKQRRAPIDKKNGPRFAWDDNLKMHMTVGADVGIKVPAKIQDLISLAEGIFKGKVSMSWSETIKALSDARTPASGKAPAQSTVAGWLDKMRKMEIVKVSRDMYALNEALTFVE